MAPARIPLLLILIAGCLFPGESTEVEPNLQKALDGIYEMRDEETLQALAAIEAARPGLPAPAVYRSLLAYWRALGDPGNPALVERFRQASTEAIRVSQAWVDGHPGNAEALRYLASSLGQRSQFALAVVPNKADIVRYGLKARDTVLKAEAADPGNKDILIGIGAANYFAANIPWYLKPIAFTMGVRGGDRELGLKQIREGLREGPHSQVEGAMVLAGAMYTEQNYPEFHKVITEHVTAVHPRLLPAAMWSITGSLCGGMMTEATQTVQHAQADERWRYLQLGRIALAKKSLGEAEQDFTKAIDAQAGTKSDLAWAYYGRSLTRSAAKRNDGGDMKRAKETAPGAYDLAPHRFEKPGSCRP